MPAGEQCRYLKPDGSICRAHPRHGSEFCFFHCPAVAADRDAARKAGGVERSRRAAVLPADTPDKALDSAADVGRLVADTINQALRGEIDARIANNVGYLASILLKTIDRTAVEQRLARLEKIVASQSVTTDWDPIEIVGRREYEEIADTDDDEGDGDNGDLDGEGQEEQEKEKEEQKQERKEEPEKEDSAEQLDPADWTKAAARLLTKREGQQ